MIISNSVLHFQSFKKKIMMIIIVIFIARFSNWSSPRSSAYQIYPIEKSL